MDYQIRHRSFLPIKVIALSVSLALTSCASVEQQIADSDPDLKLNQLLKLYRANLDHRTSCQEVWQAGHATVDCERILRAVEKLAFEFPQHQRVRFTSALLNYQAGRPDKAQHDLDAILALNPGNPEVVLLRSRIALEQGNLPLARRILQRQIQLHPERADLRETLAAVLYMSGQYRSAKILLDTAERLGAPAWRIAYHRGLLAEAQGKWQEARRHYQTCLEFDPDNAPARARLAGIPG